jgi:lipopolysaccharide biosynthesis regulator YciM
MFEWVTSLELCLMTLVGGALGYHYGYQAKAKKYKNHRPSQEYLRGIQYLINGEPDKAVDLFIEFLEATDDTVETHFALGSLFRKRGEVDRSIRIHQNLIERSSLPDHHKEKATLELAKDYLSAGVLDRAEKIFLERVAYGNKDISNYRHLLYIYQREKDWERCIKIIEGSKISASKKDKTARAHFYCEWVSENLHVQPKDQLLAALKKAKQLDHALLRIELLLAELAMLDNQPLVALTHYHLMLSQSGIYIDLVLGKIQNCFALLDDDSDPLVFYSSILSAHPYEQDRIIISIADIIKNQSHTKDAIAFIKKYITQKPSMVLMQYLVTLYSFEVYGDLKNELALLSKILTQSLQAHHRYQCMQCGFLASKFFWNCASCHQWSSISYEKS